jgi:hypothetical protein
MTLIIITESPTDYNIIPLSFFYTIRFPISLSGSGGGVFISDNRNFKLHDWIKLFHRDFFSLDPQSLMSKDLVISKMAFLPSKRKKRSRRNIFRLLPFTSSIRPVSDVPTAK